MLRHVYPGQRPIRPYHVDFLRDLIVRGDLRPGTMVSFAVVGTVKFLVNGQHTLLALGSADSGPIWLQVEEIRVPSLAEVAVLYESYDRALARSWRDLYRADMTLQDEALTPTHLTYLGGAMMLLASGFQTATGYAGPRRWMGLLRNARVRFALMADWTEEAHQFWESCQGPPGIRKALTRAAVLAVVLVTYRYQPDAAHRFWPRVARDSGLVDGDPAHTLLRFLRETTTRHLDPAAYARTVAAAWNAACAERSLQRLQGRSTSVPLLLAGTPHTGTAHLHYLRTDGSVCHEPVVWEEASS
jgi:hypothetical protein